MTKLIDSIVVSPLGGKLSLLWFLVTLAALLYLSMKLEKYSTGLVEKTSLGGAFIGGALIALITSAPEFVTEIVQAARGEPEMGLANDLGSNLFSIFMMGTVAIIFIKKAKFLNDASRLARYSMYYSAAATLIAFIGSWIGNDVVIGKPGTFAIGLFPAILFIGFIGMLVVQYYVEEDEDEADDTYNFDNISKNQVIGMFVLIASLVVFASFALNLFVSAMSDKDVYNIPEQSAGGIFLAITTSLPEVVIFWLFIKRGLYTLGITAITGSHAFNLGITFFGDLIYTDNPSFKEMHDMRWIALTTLISISLLAIQLIFSKKLTKTKYYLCIPTLISITYLVAWPLMLTL